MSIDVLLSAAVNVCISRQSPSIRTSIFINLMLYVLIFLFLYDDIIGVASLCNVR